MSSSQAKRHSTTETSIRIWLNIMVAWLVFSSFLATGPQYVFFCIFFLWLLKERAWRVSQSDFPEGTRAIFIGLFLSVVITFISSICGWILDSGGESISTLMYEVFHLTGKWSIRGVLIIGGFAFLKKRGIGFEDYSKPLFILMTIHFIYLLLQRFTGIDLVHGIFTKLPDHRLSHGIYRVSGFTGHPLSLAYSALLLSIVGLQNAWPECGTFKNGQKKWFILFVFSFATLFLSQSRWPIAVVLLLVFMKCFLSFKTFFRGKGNVLGLLGLVVCSIIWLGTSERYSELWQPGKTIEERVPRIAFWKVHWSMFQDHPVLGVGILNRNRVKLDYYDRGGYTNISRKYSAHNIYLQTLSDSGILGLVGLLFLIGPGILIGLKARKHGDSRLIYYMIAVLLSGLMQNTFRDSEFVFTYWVGFALILTGSSSWKISQKSQTHKESIA